MRSRVLALMACAVCLGSLPACDTLRHAEHPAAAPSAPPASAENPAPPPATTANAAPDSGNDTVQAGGTAVVPACIPVESKSKPRPKPKPKVVRKEAPPQLPTAPVVVETPAGGLVDAQVRPMPVSVMSILGKRVQGPKGEDLGRVVDVLADASGRVRIAIVDFGGFLGVGNHRIAVAWPLLRFNPDGRDPSLLLSLSREKLQHTPEYRDDPRPQTLMEPPSAAPPDALPPAGASAPASAAPAASKK